MMNHSQRTAPRMPSLPQTGQTTQAAGTVRVSPSRTLVERRDPSLSFTVSAPGMAAFDVAVATDPALFSPAEAHRRTAKNFRLSRQDFDGQPIDTDTGFYMLPRAFLRDVISVSPRPDRLFYLAIGYPTHDSLDGTYSTALDNLDQMPSVGLSASLTADSLSRVLGMRVEQMGLVGRSGRVARPLNDPAQVEMPRMIGGLPVTRAAAPRPSAATPATPRPPVPSQATPPVPPPLSAQPTPSRPQPADPPTAPTAPLPDAPARGALPEPAAGQGAFVDEDAAFGEDNAAPPPTGFRDLDAGGPVPPAAPSYDDGFGAMSFEASGPEDTPAAPLPALDPVPADATGPAVPPPAPTSPAPTGPAPTAAPRPAPSEAGGARGDSHEALVELVIARGAGNRYDALNLDGAFRGRMGTDHPYYQRAHEGLRFGPHQVAQDSGELGELLALMQEADAASFARIFGPEADALVALTTAQGPASPEVPGGRSARVQPLAGKDLWEEPWASRFREAGGHAPFQSAMRAHIIARRIEPMEDVRAALGLVDTQGRALLAALAIHLGVPAATAALRAAINPFDAPAKTAAALEALGHHALEAFQRAHGLAPSDNLDTPTHFALIGALRALGPDSPVGLPDTEAVKDLIVTSQPPGAVGDALLKLRTDAALADGETL